MSAPITSAALAWPTGLQSLQITLIFEENTFDRDAFVGALIRRAAAHHVRNDVVSVPAASKLGASWLASTLRIEIRSEDAFIHWHLGPVPEGVSELPRFPAPGRIIEIQEVLPLLLEFFSGTPAEEPIVARGYFELPIADWRPAMELPAAFPGVLEGAEGSPRVTGLEFVFTEPSSRVRTASVRLDSNTETVDVEMLVAVELEPHHSAVDRTGRALQGHLSLFALPRLAREEPTDA